MVYIINDPKKIETKRELASAPVDRLAAEVETLRKIQQEIREAQAYEKKVKNNIKLLLGEAEEGTVNGAVVVRWQKIDGYSWAKFFADNPLIAEDEELTVVKEVRVPDVEAIKAKHGGLLAAYQTRQFNIV